MCLDSLMSIYSLSIVGTLAERSVVAAFHGAVVIGYAIQLVDAFLHSSAAPLERRNVLGHIESGQWELHEILLLRVSIDARVEVNVETTPIKRVMKFV